MRGGQVRNEEGEGGRKAKAHGAIRVLLVDDETRFRENFGRLLKGRGFEVIAAENGQVALDALSRHAVDLILLDLKMPVMGGEEFLHAARPLYPTIPVIILSGHGALPIAVDCMKKGAFDFVTKPFEIEELVLTMERAIEKRDLERKVRVYQEETVRSLLALNTEKKRLETMVNCIPNGIMVTNEKLEIVLHNPALFRLLGLPGPSGCPVPLSHVIKDASLVEALERIQRSESPEG
ncbi:MAG: response regulator, partial [Proteobacteria bacterium]|nr:response regulator [Pseudomonadota bacterium]